MTVQTNNNSISYVGNGSTAHFDYDYLILDASHLKVYFGDVLQTSGYVVSGVSSQTGGTVAFAVAPPNGTNITLIRDVPFLQLTDYQPYDAFPAESHERALDLLTMMAQQLKDELGRTMQYPVGGDKWDARGNEIINVGTGGSGTSATNVDQVKYLIASEVGDDPSASASARSREALRRSYAEAGFNLVTGSFELGSTVTTATDVLLYEADGKAYSWGGALPKTVVVDSNPSSSGGINSSAWIDESPLAPRERTVLDYGATTESSNNTPSFNAAAESEAVIKVPNGTFQLGETPPDYDISGPGIVVSNGVDISAGSVKYNPELEIFSHTPKDYQREHLGITYPPPPFATAPGAQKRYRAVFSLGSQLGDPNKLAGYVTAFGNFNGANFNQWFAVDAFGGDTLMYAYNVERTVAVGSESLAWFGAPSSQYLIDYKHDWWRRPSSNPYLPGEPLWNFNGLADIHPGLSAEIAAYTDYAATTADAGNFTTIGRNAGNHTVKGSNCLFAGYAAGQDFYAGSNCTGVGALSLRSVVFGTNLTAVGRESGMVCKDSVDASFFGHASGRTIKNASRSVYLGVRTGDGCARGEGAVLLGYQAGKGFTNLDDLFILCNDGNNKHALISGNFSTNNAGVGLNPDKNRARWHVRFTDSGSTIAPASGLLVEGATAAAATVETSNTGYGSYRFADPQSNYVGGMEYAHSSDSLSFFTNGASRWRIRSDGHFHPLVDNAYSVGISSLRASVIYAGTGTINTSDAREKTAPKTIDDDVLDAWGDVQLIAFQWLNAIQEKGADVARWHFGVIAQQVRDAFDARGLDGTRYGLLCYDEWDDRLEQVIGDDGEPTGEMKQVVVAGNRWGIRPDQCLFLEAAYQRRRCDRIEERLTSAGL